MQNLVAVCHAVCAYVGGPQNVRMLRTCFFETGIVRAPVEIRLSLPNLVCP